MNRFGRSAGSIERFRTKSPVADGLQDIRREAGQDDEALASVGSGLADIFGRIADDQAETEGKIAGKQAGLDPAFRPDGQTTIRGKAFEKAAIDTYNAQLDVKLRDSMLTAYQQHQRDPAALKAALDGIEAKILQNDAFPQNEGEVRARMGAIRSTLQLKSIELQEERGRDEARAAVINANAQGEARVAAIVETRPYAPETQAAKAAELKRLDDQERRLVESGAMTAEQAARNSLRRRQEADVREGLAAIDRLGSVEEVDRRLEEFKQKKAAGQLGTLGQSAEAMDKIETALDRRRTQLVTEGTRRTGHLNRIANDMVSRAEAGNPPPPDEMARLRAEAAVTPGGEAALAQAERRIAMAQQVAARGPQAAEEMARRLRAEGGQTPSRAVADEITYLDGLAARQREAIAKDPMGHAARQRIVAVEPLNLDDPNALAGGIRARAATAAALPEALNPDRKMLMPEDVKAITRKIGMGGDSAVKTLEALVAGAGKDAPRLMGEIGGSAPELAQAGLIMASGGSAQAARDAVAGHVLRNIDGGANMKEVDAGTFGNVFNKIVGSTLWGRPEDQSRIKKTAMLIAQYRLRNTNINTGPVATVVYEQAIQEAIGRNKIDTEMYGGIGDYSLGWYTFSGSKKVIVPPEVRADRFRDVILAIRDDDLAGLPNPPRKDMTARQHFHQAVPVATRDGYRFAMGDPDGSDPRWIQDVNGRAFVLPWAQLSPALRQRAPGAFRGSR